MARSIANVTIATDTFAQWVGKTNELADLVSTGAVTVAANSSGDTVTGNGTIVGTLVTTTLVANSTIRGGNLTSTNTLSIGSNVAITGTANATVAINVGANVSANTIALKVGNSSVNTVITSSSVSTGDVTVGGVLAVKTADIVANTKTISATNALTVIDSFPLADTSACKYLINIKNSTTGRHTLEMLVMHDGTDVYSTRYAELFNTSLGIFSASINATAVAVNFTPAATGTFEAATLRIQVN